MGEQEELKEKQKFFCELFASDREFFGNGTQSYIEAYNIDMSKKGAYNVAMASASRLLRNVKITNYINELFEARGLNDVFVDKQLEKLITQDADFKTKLGAIKEYNNLKKRIENPGGVNINVFKLNEDDENKINSTISEIIGNNKGQDAEDNSVQE